eukprot:gene31974-40382_t
MGWYMAVVNRVRTKPVTLSDQVVIWFSGGMRGAVAFALALDARESHDLDSEVGDLAVPITLFVVLFTLALNGGATFPLLKALKMLEHDENASKDDGTPSQIVEPTAANWLVRAGGPLSSLCRVTLQGGRAPQQSLQGDLAGQRPGQISTPVNTTIVSTLAEAFVFAYLGMSIFTVDGLVTLSIEVLGAVFAACYLGRAAGVFVLGWGESLLPAQRCTQITAGSMTIGVALGCLCALVLKHTYIHHEPPLETAVFWLFPYGSYLIAEQIELSGVMSILFCGISMGHYAYYNLSMENQ